MFANLSVMHLLLFLVIVVLVFGTGKLRNAGRDLGGFVKGFKEGMKSDDEAASQAPQQLTQQDSAKASHTADKKDNV